MVAKYIFDGQGSMTRMLKLEDRERWKSESKKHEPPKQTISFKRFYSKAERNREEETNIFLSADLLPKCPQ